MFEDYFKTSREAGTLFAVLRTCWELSGRESQWKISDSFSFDGMLP